MPSPPTQPKRLHRQHRSMATLLALLIALPMPLRATAQVRLPALGEAANADLSVAEEKRIGESIMREGRRDPTFLDDPVLLDYLQSIWAPLLAAARHRGDIEPEVDRYFAWESFLLSERSVNAFALPGGYVGVHLGMIAISTTRDQLASVLAHELSHVTQRHIARSVAPGQRASLVGLAAMLLGIFAATRGASADVVNASIAGGQATAIQGQLNFSRDVEREADRVGFGLLGDAGYSTAGMGEMFERLEVANRLNDNGNFPYLRSHPLTVDRIAEARSRNLLPGNATASPPLAHALMQARARVLMDTSAQGLQRLVGGASSSALAHDRLAATYAAAMAAARLKDRARMAALLPALDEALLQTAAAQPREPLAERAWVLLKAEVLLAQGNASAAVQAMAPLSGAALAGLAAGTSTRPALLLQAQAALEWQRQGLGSGPGQTQTQTQGQGQGQGPAATALRRSTEDLQTWVADQAHDPLAWELLAATADALGLKLRSMRAGAEARAAVGDLVGAIDRLRAAQASARTVAGQDFIEASVIDSRLRRLVAERRQLVLDARGPSATRGPGREGDDPTAPSREPAPEPAPSTPTAPPARSAPPA